MPKIRLDQLLIQRGLVDTRQKAQALIMRGDVLVKDEPATKAGVRFEDDVEIRLRNSEFKYVGRGGEKLESALNLLELNLKNRIAIDIGASTGGFTDCLLKNGVSLVYAIDVGTNQLDYSLRKDPRVIVYEKTNAKDLSEIVFDPKPNLAVIDVSFISVRKILESVVSILDKKSEIIVLVKPQFELDRERISKGGVVKSESDRQLAVDLVSKAASDLGYLTRTTIPSGLKGLKKGNQEYFSYLVSSLID